MGVSSAFPQSDATPTPLPGVGLSDISSEPFVAAQTEMTRTWSQNLLKSGKNVEVRIAGRGTKRADMKNAEAAQAKIIDILACPGTGGALDIVALELAGEAIRRGAVFSRELGGIIGRIENFQLDFVRLGETHSLETLACQAGTIPRIVDRVPEWRLVPHNSSEVQYEGSKIYFDSHDMVCVESADSAISFEASGEIEILLYAHRWSGIAEIRTLDAILTVDLFDSYTEAARSVRLDLGAKTQRVVVKPTGEKNQLSLGRQCLFSGFRQKTGHFVPLRHQKETRVRGSPFSEAFHELMATVPQDGVLVDLGGGNRQLDDPRYVNIDYADYPEADIIADATKLPIRDASVDAVYSSGVFEHIGDPFKAAAEVARILKPGGTAIIGWAFMQPVHSEGQHFYNATRWGVERAFSALKVRRTWYDASLAFLVEWGASVSGLSGLAPPQEIQAVCDTLRRWDALIPETHKQYMASGVWCELEKA